MKILAKLRFLMILGLQFGNLLSNVQNLDSKKQVQNDPHEVWVNVFIHGIVRPVVDITDMIQIARQKTKQTKYKHVTKYVRRNSDVHRTQPSQGIGLLPIKMEPNPDNNGSRAIVAVIKKLKHNMNPSNQAKELYYTFGWSGLLDYSSRQKAAIFLYRKLIRLMNDLKNEGLKPKLRIIAYSHGGNVAVQMANLDPWNKRKSQLTINEFIALGMPVQRENDVLIRHPMFERVYHFYSIGDIPQKLDFVSTDFAASHRRYQARQCFEIPSKLTQIQVRFSKTVNRKRKFNKKDTTMTYDPTHIELWSFGWLPKNYNKQSPIFPFPMAAFAPYIVDIIKNHPELGTNLEANIYPDKEKIIFTKRKWSNHHKIKDLVIPFMSQQEYNEVKQIAWTRRPDDGVDLSNKKAVTEGIYFATRQGKLESHCAKTLDCRNKNCTSCKI
jgi:hypothetical protein